MKTDDEFPLILATVDKAVKERLAPLVKELEATKRVLVEVQKDRDRLIRENRGLRERRDSFLE
jgi:hypothetical protein